MQLGIRAGVEGSLALRLAWLTALRLLVLTLFLVVTTAVYFGGFTPGGFSSRIALITIASAYGMAAVYAVLLRFGRGLTKVAHAQLATDQITWTAIVYITGGAASGATSLYGLTCLSGAILLGVRGGVSAAISGLVAYVALCTAFVLRVVAPPLDQQIEVYALSWSDAAYPLFVNVMAIAVVTSLASYLAERLRATGGRLAIATARAEEAERLAVLGRVAAGLAHEIRNPLGSIAGSIELLCTGGALSVEDRKLCEIIQRETSRLNDLVGDMLDLSRPRAPNKSVVDLSTTAREVATLATRSGRGVDVQVLFDGPQTALVMADAAHMRQVVWNLVRNAVQASSPGDQVLVRLRREDDGGYGLEIRDNGPGIPAEARERLFEPFFSTRSHGIGVGLAVVKRIVDDHGFVLGVESVEGRGATFRVGIPPSAAAAEPERERHDDAPRDTPAPRAAQP